MRRVLFLALVVCVVVITAGCSAEEQTPTKPRTEQETASEGVPPGWGSPEDWLMPSETGTLDPANFVDEVANPYWQLKPGTKWTYEATTEDGTETIEVVVLPDKREVMGVECTVVRDTVKLEGELVEDTYDWYAQDKDGNVWYMGEDVDNYEDGKLKDHEGAWEAGVDGAKPGIKVWATPRLGELPYYQEYYPGKAEDLGKDIGHKGTATVPFGTYENLLIVEEWTPLEPEIIERKFYAWGVGTVKEQMVRGGTETVVLTDYEQP